MNKYLFTFLLSSILLFDTYAQDNMAQLPYYEIPEYPSEYTAKTTAARMIDGLGFRYYWATEGLTEKDLEYRPNDMARTAGETIDHILGLTNVIANCTKKLPNAGGGKEKLSFEEKRKQTLENLKQASDILKSSNTDGLEDYILIFEGKESNTEFPFWNLINGPIADALWHVGQVVSFRRSSGNPFNSKASVMTGKVRE
ncbi:hypothetical protein [Reichenbachiella sp. MALMAid0571]|uniref:hypothetical protein n=1 Tax=Reichenbachiella sp. MALMAid0571 TaxID=3143939 RepID=UPI0032DEF474